ncbi:YfaP family protein [Amantichitinum ursilacus]|uniref:DUF2135 domain-containing protein n=1 Tax=Amantichitinum ursilacus TaxID=857265 RepID=A0A0N0XJF2_9NEIS|nr:DUF2135 domain-containing protein [Amantichitinum ursilacus]KPC53747.1 hypothetical protein WG78_07885 [Amantichitinum ursilacus]
MKRSKRLLGACLLLSFSVSHATGGLEIDEPAGGWRNTAGKSERYTQNVVYPATFVNTPEGQSKMALIRGHIGNHPKAAGDKSADKPYRMLVNGVPMPLRVDEDGTFSRPYSFGAGANSVAISSPDGREHAETQFYDSNKDRISPRLRVVLSWSSNNTDLDLHVVSPDGQHCYYGDRVVKNGGALDVDVTSGYGPEIYANPSPPPGRYLVYVNYYGGYSRDGAANREITVAQVSIISNENTLHEKQQMIRVPMRKPGELTLVGSFVYP